MEKVPYLILELSHFNNLSRGTFSASNFSIFFIFQRFNFFFAMAINALLVILPNVDDEQNSKTAFKNWYLRTFNGDEFILWILCLVLLFSYLLTTVMWFYFQFRIKKQSLLLKRKQKNDKKKASGEEVAPNNWFFGGVKLTWKIIFQSYLINLLVMITMMILGLTRSKLYLSVVLLDIVTISPSLKNIVKSLSFNIKSLLSTVSLILILVLSFTSITYFTSLRENYIFLEDNTLNLCENYFQCFITMANFGVRSGGGIGDLLLYPNYSTHRGFFYSRTIFDFVFFSIVVMIMLSIVSAMIIDSFTELREIRDEKGKPLSIL